MQQSMSSREDRPDFFVSAKTTDGPVPAPHPALRAALVQASLDPATRSISHVATADVGSAPVEVEAVVVVRYDGPFVLDVVPARPVLKFDKTLLRDIALRGLGLASLVVTSEDLAAEPRRSNIDLVWSHRGRAVPVACAVGSTSPWSAAASANGRDARTSSLWIIL
jgi:hypothetical protein